MKFNKVYERMGEIWLGTDCDQKCEELSIIVFFKNSAVPALYSWKSLWANIDFMNKLYKNVEIEDFDITDNCYKNYKFVHFMDKVEV